jgi:ketosteroid isomerase-like protein
MLIAALLALSIAKTPAAQIEAAERAFAADGGAMGIKGSFLKHMADDAIVFSPTATNAKALYEAKSAEGEPKLQWWPIWVVAAKSGDLGLSTGPWAIDGKRGGWFATIWRKDTDGTWRWVYDGGSAAEAASVPGPEAPASVGQNTAEAYKAALSDDARLLGPRGTRAQPATALAPRLAARPSSMNLNLRGGGASKAGDLVWTNGEATWTEGPKAVAAHYMHVWQRRPEGWRLIFETLNNDR